MKELTNIQLQVVKSIERSIESDQKKLERLNSSFERKLGQLEGKIADLRGSYAANKELLELSIERAHQSIVEFTGGAGLKDILYPVVSDDVVEIEETDGSPFAELFKK